MKKRHGQILILILLIVVVALAVGLSVASRNITNLRTSTQTEHSQRALTAAEGGIEDALSRLSTFPTGSPQPVLVGNITANVQVNVSNVYEATIEPGEVGQIDLKGASTSNIIIEWAKKNDPSEADAASIEVVLVKDLGGGTYGQTRSAWRGGGHIADELGSSWSFPGPDATCNTTEYLKCAKIPREANSIILRIRPFWTKTTMKIWGLESPLPTQTYGLTSQATTEIGVTRKVQVTRTALPQLPAAFDFVLYSEGDITK